MCAGSTSLGQAHPLLQLQVQGLMEKTLVVVEVVVMVAVSEELAETAFLVAMMTVRPARVPAVLVPSLRMGSRL